MATLPESAIFEEGIFQIEKSTPPLGGAPVFSGSTPTAGHANAQAAQLANRTQWLKEELEKQSSISVVNIENFGDVGSGEDAYIALQSLINEIAGTGKIGFIPDGDYPLSDTVVLPKGNFTLQVSSGATLRRSFSISPKGYRTLLSINALFSETPSQYLEDINIYGGSWKCESQLYGPGNIFSILGVKNLQIKNSKFYDVEDAHALDIACFDGVYIENCKFYGFRNGAGDREYSEAIQLDPAADFPSNFSDTWNGRNIYVKGCYFGSNPLRTEPGWGSWGGGIGNHALAYNSEGVALGGIHTNVHIKECIFDSCLVHGIRPLGWRGVIIEDNKFLTASSTSSGILIEHGFVRPADGSVPENYKIISNNFEGLGIFINVPNPPDGVYVAVKKQIKKLEIAFNTFKRTSGTANILSLSWVQGLIVKGNICETTGGSFISSRFLADCIIEGNVYEGGSTFLYVTEVGAEYIGTNLTRNISLRGNIVRKCTARTVHFNGACQQALVAENIFEDVVTNGTLPLVVGDTNARGITVVNNRYRRSSSSINLPSVGVLVGGLDHFIGYNDWGDISIPVTYSSTSVGTGRIVITYSGENPNTFITAPIGSSCLCIGTSPGQWYKTTGVGSNTGWQKLAFV